MSSLVSIQDLQALMKVDFTGDALEQAQLVLDMASSWARVVSGRAWPDAPTGVPDDVRAVVLQAARRELTNPEKIIERSMGPFSVKFSAPPDGFFSPAELAILKRFRKSQGLMTMGVTRGEEGRPDAGKIGWLHFGEGDGLFPFCGLNEGYGDPLPWDG